LGFFTSHRDHDLHRERPADPQSDQSDPVAVRFHAAGPEALLCVILGGGVLAGAIGVVCFCAALKKGTLSQVMPIAFTSLLFGVLLAVAV